jgi:hypothetical protein
MVERSCRHVVQNQSGATKAMMPWGASKGTLGDISSFRVDCRESNLDEMWQHRCTHKLEVEGGEEWVILGFGCKVGPQPRLVPHAQKLLQFPAYSRLVA